MSTYVHAPTPIDPDTGPSPSRGPFRTGASIVPAPALAACALAAALAGCGGGSDGSSPVVDPSGDPSPGPGSRALDAGDALTLTSAAGTWATVPRDSFDDAGEPFYQLEPLTGSVPRGLVLDVPGAEFPGFANVAVPDLEPVALSSPSAGESVGADVRVVVNAGDARLHVDRISIDRVE